MAAGLLFLLCAAAVLFSSEAQDSYTELPGSYRQGVDLALEQLGSSHNVKLHFRFLRSVEKREHEGYMSAKLLYHHFYLKPTSCPKGTAISDSQRCSFRNDRPLMDCLVCYKTVEEQMEPSPPPYVHCIQKPRLTQDMRTKRLDYWNKLTYKTGSATTLALSSG
uniref:Retinoic acid receptor responder protein 2 n=1 Tax=Kryptolebias marmoratus TaxID=37003 RepID=A0A3Q3BCU2_KRYMA